MAGLDVKVSQLGEVVVASDNDLLNLVTYDEQNQTYVSGKVKASTMKEYMIGDTDISGLGDGTPTGAIDALDGKIDDNYDEWKEQWKKNGAYNLLPNNGTTQVINGITFTFNSDGTVTVQGTLTPGQEYAIIRIYQDETHNLPSGTYRLCGCPTPNESHDFWLNAWDVNADVKEYGSGVDFTITAGVRFYAAIVIHADVPNAITFKPMLTTDFNVTYADYVPYAKTNRELTERTLAENIKSQTSYAAGMDSSKFTYSVCKFGKVVTVNFIVQSLAIPSTGWGKTDLVTGLPVTMDGFSPRVAGYSMTNKIKFAFEITSSGTMRLVRDENTVTAENLPTYWGMSIVYIAK